MYLYLTPVVEDTKQMNNEDEDVGIKETSWIVILKIATNRRDQHIVTSVTKLECSYSEIFSNLYKCVPCEDNTFRFLSV